MMFVSRRLLVIALACCASAAPLRSQRPSDARVVVGPNILVSRDGNVPHIEPHLATHPSNANVLVATVTVQRDLGTAAGAYASHDGGYSWRSSALSLTNTYDPQVAVGATGTVYYAVLADSGRRFGLFVARSEDGGLTWQQPVFLATGQDHEQIVIDRTSGRFAGRIYLGSLYGRDYHLGVFRSDDDGRTWRGPQRYLEGTPQWGHNTNNLLVLSDGSLFAPFLRWTRGRAAGQDTSYAGYALSTDGGETFAAPRIIRVLRAGDPMQPGRPRQFPEYAVNDRGAVHRDRIYIVFPQDSLARLHLQYSDDRGVTWSKAKRIDPTVPAHAEQFQQMIAVNKDGVVGVTWFDTRAKDDRSVFDQYFAASVDGGETFLPAVRVSTESTLPESAGNLTYVPSASVNRDTVYIYVGRAAGRIETGGDYMGLAPDEEGVFHAVWTDARSGTYQLYTSAIRVLRGTDQTVATRQEGVQVRTLRATEFSIIFDPARYDAVTGEISVPFRIKNLMQQPIYGPLTMRLDVNPTLGDRGKVDAKFYPMILGAANGKTGPGAEFDLTPLMGSGGSIVPGATTGSFTLRVKHASPNDPYLGRMMTLISAAVP